MPAASTTSAPSEASSAADLGDPAVLDADVGLVARGAEPVDDGAALDRRCHMSTLVPPRTRWYAVPATSGELAGVVVHDPPLVLDGEVRYVVEEILGLREPLAVRPVGSEEDPLDREVPGELDDVLFNERRDPAVLDELVLGLLVKAAAVAEVLERLQQRGTQAQPNSMNATRSLGNRSKRP